MRRGEGWGVGKGGRESEHESGGGYVPGILNPALMVTAKTKYKRNVKDGKVPKRNVYIYTAYTQ